MLNCKIKWLLILVTFVVICLLPDHCLSKSGTKKTSLLQVPNYCNDCSKNGCLNGGKCRMEDGRCDCQMGFWGNRCQYKYHEMYKFGHCPTFNTAGKRIYDWPQLEPGSCHTDEDCPGLWKCCPTFSFTPDKRLHRGGKSPTGTRSCTQPTLKHPEVAELPLCLQHLWNVTEAGRTFRGCDMLMCDESSGGRTFDLWQCNYCDENATTCFCFINFDNEGKYWGELPGSRQRLDVYGDISTQRPGVIHRKPKHNCSIQDICPQMFPQTVYCSHGVHRDSSGCPTGDCLPNPEEKCFTPCPSGFLCEHRPEPEQVNQWHCIDTFRQFRVSVPVPSRLTEFIRNDLKVISAKAIELIAQIGTVDETVLRLLTNLSVLPCDDEEAQTQQNHIRTNTAAAQAYLLPLKNSPKRSVIEVIGEVAFSAHFKGVRVRRQLQNWINATYWQKMKETIITAGKKSHAKEDLGKLTTTVVLLCSIVAFLGLVGIPLFIFRRRLFSKDNKLSSQTNNTPSHLQGIFSVFTNPSHRYGGTSGGSGSGLPSSAVISMSQQSQLPKTAVKCRPAPLPPQSVTPLPESSFSSASPSSQGASHSSVSSEDGSASLSSPSDTKKPTAVTVSTGKSPRNTNRQTGQERANNANDGYHAF